MALFLVIVTAGRSAAAQQVINEPWEGTFSARVAGRAIADTVHVRGPSISWIRHTALGRTLCHAELEVTDTESGTEIDPQSVGWRCGAETRRPARLEFDDRKDVWRLGLPTAAGADPVVFQRVGRNRLPEDTLPRAVQPPPEVGDSIVREVLAIYVLVNGYKCGRSEVFFSLTVCSHGDTVRRITTEQQIEALDRKLEFTYDADGALRFAFVTFPITHRSYRYYFGGGHLARALVSTDSAENRRWDPSGAAWARAEQDMLEMAESCLQFASPMARSDTTHSYRCGTP